MDFMNIIWVVLLLVSFAPMVKKRIIESARLRLMQKIEQKRGSRVIALIHRQERMSILGIPIARYIDIQDSEAVLRAIQRDIGEIIVNPGPVRLGLVFEQLSPGFARWVLEKAGAYDYYRRQAEEERESLWSESTD